MSRHDARFITPTEDTGSAPHFRIEFDLEAGHGDVTEATLQLSALGICEAWINGAPVSDHLLTPGWSSYEWRLHFVEHDVAAHLQARSALAIAVGNGWYRGRLGWFDVGRYGDRLAAWAHLQITYADGYRQSVVTDDFWAAGPSEITQDDFYDGQHIDARVRSTAWQHPGFISGPGWGSVRELRHDVAEFTTDPAPPVRRVDEQQPGRVWRSETGSVLVDFGQNIVGFTRIRTEGPRGHVLTVRHAEVLENGALSRGPLRTAEAVDVFTLSGAVDVFEPTFTFHGFRYAELDGWPGDLDDVYGAVSAVVISSDLTRTGRFACSVPELNTLHANIVRGMRGNFIDLPTDCPQRDERLGWTGDISVFAPTAAYLFDVRTLLSDWLQDLAVEQSHNGGIVPFTVPDVLKYAADPDRGTSVTTAVWADAAVWVPWALYQAYGDTSGLTAAFDSMLTHGRHEQMLLSPTGVWDTGFQYGDWLDPDAPAEHPEQAKADPGVVATAAAYRTAEIVRQVAEVLGRDAEAQEFTTYADRLRRAFSAAYVHVDRITSDCTTVYAVAIAFGLLDDTDQAWAGRRLAELVAESGHVISTGFAGTPYILDALTVTGHTDTAYRLLLQRACPSWLYPVTMGATTVWERWDSLLPDGSVNPGEMTSFNHYALGAVADWMHRILGGLAPLTPGYDRILIAPRPGPGVDWAETSLETRHGTASVHWQRDGATVILRATVPDGATAVVQWPGSADTHLPAGAHTLHLHPALELTEDLVTR